MAVRVLMMSVLVAVAAALIPSFMQSHDVHAAEALQSVHPATPAPADPASPHPLPANRTVELDLPVVTAPIPAEVSLEPVALPNVQAPAPVTFELPATAETPAPEAVAPEAPVAAAATTQAVPAAIAPTTVAGYTIGDLAPQAASATAVNPSVTVTGSQMLPEGVDVDPNSDMVEILVASAGQGAMFPAEIEADYSTDMVAIVLDDEGMFPAGAEGDLSGDMVQIPVD